MSGPVDGVEAGAPGLAQGQGRLPRVEVTDDREVRLGALPVRRALPMRARRTVGAWCFADHMGPVDVADGGVEIGPHPHTGLHTVTWLVEGEVLHRDSVGTEQVVAPGQLNLMTAGRGVSHAEESVVGSSGRVHGLQLWVAQPEGTRHGEPAFEHHAELPRVEAPSGIGTVLLGAFAGIESPARQDTPLLGVDLLLHGGLSEWELDPAHEHALLLLDGAAAVDGTPLRPGQLAYLGTGRDVLVLDADGPARAVLLGGEPFPEPVVMWWNFVGRTREEVAQAWQDWTAERERFGTVASDLARVPTGPPPWLTAR